MARIADKYGLTNKYRQSGIGKRVVRRGRPRKHLFGSSRRKSHNVYVDERVARYTGVAIGIFAIISIILFLLLNAETFSILSGVLFIICPLIIFPLLFFFVDKRLKIYWKLPNYNGSIPTSLNRNIPNHSTSTPASWGWFTLTMIEMGVCFFMNFFVVLDLLKLYVVLINVAIYILWSIFILLRKNK